MEDTPGEDAILSPRPRDWGWYFAHAPVASSGFMDRVDDLPVQDRPGGVSAVRRGAGPRG
jgi:virulence-associated protein VagC